MGPAHLGETNPAQGRAGTDLCGYGQKRTFCRASQRARGRQKEPTISEQEPIPGQGSYGQGGTAWGAGQSQPPPPPGASPWSSSPYPPAPTAAQRVQSAMQARAGTDYIFDFWSALGWTVLTLGFYGYYVFYQLMRRMRDHNARRVELLDATLSFGWEEAGRRGLQEELTPAFQRAAWHLAAMRKMAAGSLEPVVWLVLSVVASGIVHVVAFILLDQDLVKHDEAEVGVEYELAAIFGRLGYALPFPDAHRLKGRHNYVGRIVATFFSFGILLLVVVLQHDAGAKRSFPRQLVARGRFGSCFPHYAGCCADKLVSADQADLGVCSNPGGRSPGIALGDPWRLGVASDYDRKEPTISGPRHPPYYRQERHGDR